ncbi:MAG: GNAT family N-acetyltransferase [archaeon]|mgnify:FL=1
MTIRRATLADLETVLPIMQKLDDENNQYTEEKAKKDITDQHMYVSVHDEKIVGAMVVDTYIGTCEIVRIVSNQKGNGREMVEYVIEKCKKEKIPKVWCWSSARHNAEGFYEKMGFEERYLLHKQWHGKDCWIFGKVIK